MKRILVAVLAAVLVLPIAVMAEEATVASDAAAQANKTFNVYTDRRYPDNNYIDRKSVV